MGWSFLGLICHSCTDFFEIAEKAKVKLYDLIFYLGASIMKSFGIRRRIENAIIPFLDFKPDDF